MKSSHNVQAVKYMECLNVMSKVECTADNIDFLQYAKLWVEQVNRGGLFRVNNDTWFPSYGVDF